jgi:hypothetical protein
MADFLSSLVSPWSQPNSWDTIQIGSVSWFGKFEIKSAARKYRWNVADGWGFAGAFEQFQAQPPARFTITFYLWADSQYSTYIALVQALTYSPTHLPPNNATATSTGSSVSALSVTHPQLQNNGITQAIVESIGSLEKQSDDLLFSFQVDFIEFVPQQPFPPQTPDTTAAPNDPLINPVNQDLLVQGKELQQQISSTVANMGQPSAMP